MTFSPTPSTSPSARRDAGFTLVEVLISIVLMGTVIAAIVGGLLTLIRATETSTEQAEVEAVLVSAADNVAAEEWKPCPASAYAQAVENAVRNVDPDLDSGWTASSAVITNVEYWLRDPSGLANGSWTNVIPSPDPAFPTECQLAKATDTPETTLQKVTIRVTSPSGSITRHINVVKSIVTDAAGVPNVP